MADQPTYDEPLDPVKGFASSIEEVTVRGLDRILGGIMDLYNVLLCRSLAKAGNEDSESEEIKEMREQFLIAFEELIERLASTDEEFSWYFKDMSKVISPVLAVEMALTSKRLGRFMNAPNN